MSVHYCPGDAPVAVTARGLVALPSDVPVALADLIWQRVRDGQGLAAVFEALTDVYGASLTALPPFAVALADGSAVRLAVRGGLAVTVTSAAGTESISGVGVTTWVERVIEGVTRVALRQSATVPTPTPDAADAAPGASGRVDPASTFDLPIVDGVVLASGAEWTPGAAAGAGSAPAEAPGAETATSGGPEGTVSPASLATDGGSPAPLAEPEAFVPAPLAFPSLHALNPEPEPEPEPEPAFDARVDSAEPVDPSSELAPAVDPLLKTAEPAAPAEPIAPAERAPGPADSAAQPAPERPALPARGPWSALAATPPPVPPVPVPPAPAAHEPALVGSAAVLSAVDADTLLPTASTIIPPRPADRGDEPTAEAVEATTGYDHLWGMTVVRSVEDAAVREVADDEATEAARGEAPGAASASGAGVGTAASDEGDHDGATISVAQLRAMRGGLADSAPPPLAPPRLPAPGRLRMSTGQVLVLDRTVVIGRRPRATRMTGTDLPHLVAVDSPQQDISRSHVEIRVEGGAILATDLRTTNGTTLRRPGSEPMRLHPGEATIVVAGDVIDLGDGITVAVEDPS
ncbi:FHA domain-containing protein [Microbacterium sp. BWT-B31]|uniref:FHA domain-containing protein n=1 Tax=Microbacterium sp. BWT-B31 TaxID=3232072 RepID=UPI00352778E9